MKFTRFSLLFQACLLGSPPPPNWMSCMQKARDTFDTVGNSLVKKTGSQGGSRVWMYHCLWAHPVTKFPYLGHLQELNTSFHPAAKCCLARCEFNFQSYQLSQDYWKKAFSILIFLYIRVKGHLFRTEEMAMLTTVMASFATGKFAIIGDH